MRWLGVVCVALTVGAVCAVPDLLPGDPGHGEHAHHEHHGHHGSGSAASAASASFAGVPDVSVPAGQSSVPARDPASGVPDLLLSIAAAANTGNKQAPVDYGEGIQITQRNPNSGAHHNPFNPSYKPTGDLAQAAELFGGRPRPNPFVTTTRTTRRPFAQRTTTKRPTRRTTRRPTRRTTTKRIATRRPFTQRPFTQRTTTRRPFAQRTTTRRTFTQRPFTQRPTTRRPFGKRTTTRRTFTQRPFTQRTTARRPFRPQPGGTPSKPNRPNNPFLSGQIDLSSSSNFQTSRPVTFRPRPPTPPPLLNTNPLGGPSGPKGPIVRNCPGPASALPCVEERLCDPFTGFLVSDGYKLPFEVTKDTPTVAVTQCRLKGAAVGVCCKRLPPRPSTTTSVPTGIDYTQGLSTARPRPGQKPANIFLPGYTRTV